MKKSTLFCLIGIVVFACNTTIKDSSKKNDTQDQKLVNSGKFRFEGKDASILKEQLFFHFRENLLDIDQNTFVKYEELVTEGEGFSYMAVIVDKDMIRSRAYNQRSKLLHLASYSSEQFPNYQLGDTISVDGNFDVIEVVKEGLEGPVTSVKIMIAAEYSTSYLSPSPYAYGGYERAGDGYDFEQDLVVKLDEPMFFSKDVMYLIARLRQLTEKDLQGYSKDELAYLRNELFARHGHSFQTEKMQIYFFHQPWYRPYYDDATPFLNDTEKHNALFIKSLES